MRRSRKSAGRDTRRRSRTSQQSLPPFGKHGVPEPQQPFVSDSQLGLTQEEIAILRAGQLATAKPGGQSPQGLLMLDQSSLTALGRHFDREMQRVQQELERLVEESTVVTMHVYDRAGNLIDNADAEITRYHDIMRQIDERELDFDRMAHIRDIVRGFRLRAEELERGLNLMGTATPSSTSSRGRPVDWSSPRPTALAHRTKGQEVPPVHAPLTTVKSKSNEKVDEISSTFNRADFFRDTGTSNDLHCKDSSDHASEPSGTENQSSHLNRQSAGIVASYDGTVSEEGRERSSADFDSSSASSDRSWTSTQKKKAVDKVMAQFVQWLDSRLVVYNNHGGQSSTSSQCAGAASQSGLGVDQNQQSSPSRGSKRQQRQGSRDIEGFGSKRQQKKAKVENSQPRKLACPFFKRDPRKYHLWRACPGPGWDTVHRVK
jgi:hypothetical protein